jgi:hypothetical protein
MGRIRIFHNFSPPGPIIPKTGEDLRPQNGRALKPLFFSGKSRD